MTNGIRAKNYKCFKGEFGGLDEVRQINLLIGRNNSGKSAVLDLVEYGCQQSFEKLSTRDPGSHPEVCYDVAMTAEVLRPHFPDTTSGGAYPSFANHWEYGRHFIGEKLEIFASQDGRIGPTEEGGAVFSNKSVDGFQMDQALSVRIANEVAGQLAPDLSGRHFIRLLADRDVVPEKEVNNLEISESGAGLTNVIQKYINQRDLESEVVKTTIFGGLKEIFGQDADFSEILVQRDNSNLWEIFLHENSKGQVALSNSGSGLKTVALILAMLHLVPVAKQLKVRNCVFAFEEPENNLHPALLRRLLQYLQAFIETSGATLFLTSHSSTCIDFFQTTESAQIIHVKHDGDSGSCEVAQTYVSHAGVLDDLDVRASDLLQSNGVIWVEGPSDRLYLTKWIEIESEGQIREGIHYQCMFYGGRLLSHLSGLAPDDESIETVKLLRMNRNAAILIDSDKETETDDINSTKKRLVDEFDKLDALVWVTRGREIENYLSALSVANVLETESDVRQVGQFEKLADYLDDVREGEGSRYLRSKPLFAERVRRHIGQGDLSDCLDLKERLSKLVAQIQKWNGMVD